MKKVLIVGSQGYLGSKLSGYLRENNFVVSCIDTGFFKEGVLYEFDEIHTLKKDARLIDEADIDGHDAVVMLAGISNDPFGNLSAEKIYNPTRDYAIKIAQICKRTNVQFIYPSSCSVYGAALSDDYLTETSDVNPQTPYSINKIEVENHLAKLAGDGFSPIALRFGTVYGPSPRIRFDVVINMLCGLALTSNKITLNSDGQAWRPHLHIDDVCNSVRCSLNWSPDNNQLNIFNVGNDEDNYKILDIAELIHNQVNGSELNFLTLDNADSELIRDKKIQDGVDSRTYKVCFKKIHNTLPGYTSVWDVRKGIEDLLFRLQEAGLTSREFNRKDFYRLQRIEYLHSSGQINDELYWVK